MDTTMTGPEVALARRVIGLRGTSSRAIRNRLRDLSLAEMPVMARLEEKGYASLHHDGYYRLTGRGIQQLKLQIGEFQMTRPLAALLRSVEVEEGFLVLRQTARGGNTLIVSSKLFKPRPDIDGDDARKRARASADGWADFIRSEHPRDDVFVVERLAKAA